MDYLIEDKRDIDFALKKIPKYLKKSRLLNFNSFKKNLLKKKLMYVYTECIILSGQTLV